MVDRDPRIQYRHDDASPFRELPGPVRPDCIAQVPQIGKRLAPTAGLAGKEGIVRQAQPTHDPVALCVHDMRIPRKRRFGCFDVGVRWQINPKDGRKLRCRHSLE